MRGGAAGPPQAELSQRKAWEEADPCSRMDTVLLVIPLSAFLSLLPSQSQGHRQPRGAGEHQKRFQNCFQLCFPLIETFQRLVNLSAPIFFTLPLVLR